MAEQRIFRLRTGIVIDHIPPFRSFEVVQILGLDRPNADDTVLAIGVNLRSTKHGAKDVIKVENKDLEEDDLNRISVIAPHATVSKIKDHVISEKIHVEVPDEVIDLIRCPNPNCITNHEDMKSRFGHSDGRARCSYCEKSYELGELRLL